MIVTVGGVSVQVTFVNDPAGKLMNDAGRGLKGHTSHLTHRRDRVGIDLSIRRAVGESWDEILSPEALAHTRRIAQTIEQRFPFNRIWFGNQGRKRQAKDGGASLPLLADLDSGDVSVIPHPCFLVVVDHRLRQAEALVRVEEDSDGESPLTPVLQGLLAVCAPDFGALMLHAASLVLDGAGYLCVGSSGAGKSTIAAADPGAVLSDDGSWCSQTGGTFSLFPTPFSQIAPGRKSRARFLSGASSSSKRATKTGSPICRRAGPWRCCYPITSISFGTCAATRRSGRSASQGSCVKTNPRGRWYLPGISSPPLSSGRCLMKDKKPTKPYEPPQIIDLQVDYTQAVGASRCATGQGAAARCSRGNSANNQCSMGHKATSSTCIHGAAPHSILSG